MNADNRIVANAIRAKAEPAVEQGISAEQKGFLPGRSMIENVVDVEERMALRTMHEHPRAAIFFDFKAAFPSIPHEYLEDCLEALGVPRWFRNAVASLYDETRCNISLAGRIFPGFPINAGIRQGCPLSPLLFVLVIDPFVRLLSVAFPDIFVRAYADDIALVLRLCEGYLAGIARRFALFGLISGLMLNLPKTVMTLLTLTPLPEKSWRGGRPAGGVSASRARLSTSASGWARRPGKPAGTAR